jgi:hypothetical protein
MILIWCLFVCLMLAGLAFRHSIRTTMEGFRLFLFGVPVRVPARRPNVSGTLGKRAGLDRSVAPASREVLLPPPRVVTRPGP